MLKNVIEKKFLKAIKDFHLINKNDNILVGFSGGVDSVVLTTLLLKFKDTLGISKLAIAHLNHSLRAKESHRDEEFSQSFAKQNKIPLFTKKIDIKKVAKKEGLSVEEAGRKERYAFLKEIASREGFNKIATGHHLSDLVETMLLWFIQGSRKGIKGFKSKENSIIRPLYYITKPQIEQYANKNKIPYIVDTSNLSTDIPRNLIRHEVIPILKKINPSLENSMLMEALILQMDEDFLEEEADRFSQKFPKNFIKLSEIEDLPDALKYRVLADWIYRNTGIYPSYRKIMMALNLLNKEGEKRLKIGNGYVVIKSYDIIFINKEEKKEDFKYKIKPGEEIYLKELGIILKCYTADKNKIGREKLKQEKKIACFDISEEEPEFMVRNRKKGDRFLPFGHKSEKKLKDIFIQLKIPKYMRDTIPLIEFRNKILWITGHKRSGYFPITDKTEKMICFEIKEV